MSDSKSTERRSRFEQKVARQIVALAHPQQMRTNGEMNEDASYVRNSVYFQNMMQLFDEQVQKEIQLISDRLVTLGVPVLDYNSDDKNNFSAVGRLLSERYHAYDQGAKDE